MALLLAHASGPQARVLVDTGHHYQAQNIEQIVAWLLAEGMLGGFHFNDRRYADDDLTLGSIDPYQVFRIFHEIAFFEWETGTRAMIWYRPKAACRMLSQPTCGRPCASGAHSEVCLPIRLRHSVKAVISHASLESAEPAIKQA